MVIHSRVWCLDGALPFYPHGGIGMCSCFQRAMHRPHSPGICTLNKLIHSTLHTYLLIAYYVLEPRGEQDRHGPCPHGKHQSSTDVHHQTSLKGSSPLYMRHLVITSTYLFWTHASEGNASMCSEQYLEHIRALLRFAD